MSPTLKPSVPFVVGQILIIPTPAGPMKAEVVDVDVKERIGTIRWVEFGDTDTYLLDDLADKTRDPEEAEVLSRIAASEKKRSSL